jgi:hypothetical protein
MAGPFLKLRKSESWSALFRWSYGHVGVLLLETLDASSGVHQFLLAGEKRVATGANFNAEGIALHCRASLKSMSAGAMNVYGVVIGVNTGLHVVLLSVVSGLRGW